MRHGLEPRHIEQGNGRFDVPLEQRDSVKALNGAGAARQNSARRSRREPPHEVRIVPGCRDRHRIEVVGSRIVEINCLWMNLRPSTRL